jgi:hypothetical protein
MNLRAKVSLFPVLVLVLACSAPSLAQVSTGTITGRAVDGSGALIPGVEVTIASPAMIGGARSAVTDEQGTYRFTLLAVGVYRVAFALQGFKTLNIDGVNVTVGTNMTINGNMEVSTMAEEVTVTSQAPLIDLEAATVGVNWGVQKFDNIPYGGSLRSLTSLLPGFRVTNYDVGGSGMGTGTELSGNAYGYSGSSYLTFDGMPQSSHYSDLGSYEEVQVVTAGKGAEAPNPGAFVNLVVKSGGNEFHGKALLTYERGSFQGNNVNQQLLDRGYAPGSNKFTRYSDVDLDLGGPIKKDKLWFYAAHRDEYSGLFIPGFIDDKTGESVAFYTLLRDPTLKLTYQLTDKMKLESMVQFGLKAQPYRDASQFLPVSATQNQRSWSAIGPSLKWTYIINPRMTLDMSVNRWGYWWPSSARTTAVRITDQTTTHTRGAYAANYQRPIRWSEVGNWSWFKGIGGRNNEIKAGFTTWWNKSYTLTFGYPNQQQYRYRSLAGETDPFLHPNSVLVYDYPTMVSSGTLYRSFFVNDKITASRKLTLTIGLRFDRNSSWLPEQGNPGTGPWSTRLIYPENRNFPVYNRFVPRVSFVYDTRGDGKLVLKGSYGQYAKAGPVADDVNPASTTTWTYNNWDGTIPYIPKASDLASVSGGVGERTLDPSLKGSVVHEYTAGIETSMKRDYNLRFNFIRKFEYGGSKTLDLAQPFSSYTDFRTGVDPGRDNLTGTADDGIAYVWSVPSTYPTFGKIITHRTQVRDDEGADLYSSWEVTFNKNYSNGWSFLVSYLADFIKDYNSDPQTPNSLYYNWKYPTWNYSWRFSGQKDLPFGLMYSTGFNGQTGNWYGRTVQVRDARNSTVNVMVEGRVARYPWVKLWDNRVSKRFRIAEGHTLEGMFDLFNTLNSSAVLTQGNTNGPNYLRPMTIIAPRIFRVGVRWKF